MSCPLAPPPGASTQGLGADLLPSVLVRVSPLPAVPRQLPDGVAHNRLCPLPRGPSQLVSGPWGQKKGHPASPS